MALQHLRSSTADKRPDPTAMADGQLAVNTNSASTGLFFKNSAGALVKVGPVHVGTTAPNATPAAGGTAGNSVGEQWLDTTGGTYVFKVWDGSAWRSESGTFVDVNGDVMTGALGIIAGSAAAPGLYVSGDTNTGIYSPGADQLALSTNGTGRLFVDADGKVGIATQFPAAALDLTAVSASARAIDIRGRLADNVADIRFLSNNQSTQYGTISSRGNGDFRWFLSSATGSAQVWTNSSERLRITSAGLVGIGTSAPGEILDAYGNIRFGTPNIGRIYSTDGSRGSIQISAPHDAANRSVSYGNNYYLDSSGTWTQAVTNIGGSAIELRATNGNYGEILFRQKQDPDAGGAERIPLVVTGAGNVGIGTQSPSEALTVSGNILTTGRVRAKSGTVGDVAIGFEDDHNVGLYRPGSDTLGFVTASSERARIDSAGRLLVGTSTDSGGALLQINGNRIRIATAKTPASATDTGVAGEVCWDSGYIYVCTATNTWKRAALATW